MICGKNFGFSKKDRFDAKLIEVSVAGAKCTLTEKDVSTHQWVNDDGIQTRKLSTNVKKEYLFSYGLIRALVFYPLWSVAKEHPAAVSVFWSEYNMLNWPCRCFIA